MEIVSEPAATAAAAAELEEAAVRTITKSSSTRPKGNGTADPIEGGLEDAGGRNHLLAPSGIGVP